jgi:hypothetical protein
MTYDLLEVFTVFLYCHHIHRQNQDIFFCEILAYFWNIAQFSKTQKSNIIFLTHYVIIFPNYVA